MADMNAPPTGLAQDGQAAAGGPSTGGPGSGPASTPAAGSPLADPMAKQLATLQAHFKQMKDAKLVLGKVRKSLDELLAQGETVTQKDVVKASGAWVAAGLDPKAVAGLMSSMPQDGPALAAWVTSHDDDVTAREQAMSQQYEMTRHELGVAGLRQVAAHHFDGQQAGAPSVQAPDPSAADAPAGNPLALGAA